MSLYSIGDQTDMVVVPNGTIMVFDGCTNQYASSYQPYHISYSGAWSSKSIIGGTLETPKQIHFALDSVGDYHASYVYTHNGLDYLTYTYNTVGTWSGHTTVVNSSQPGIDNIVKHWLSVGANDSAEIYYVKENYQNEIEGNLYIESFTDNFTNVTTLIDAVSAATRHHFNDVYRDSLGQTHLSQCRRNRVIHVSQAAGFIGHQSGERHSV